MENENITEKKAAESPWGNKDGWMTLLLCAAAVLFAGGAALCGYYYADLQMGSTYNIYYIAYGILAEIALFFVVVSNVRVRRSGVRPAVNRFAVSVLLALNAYLLPELVMDSSMEKSSPLYIFLGYLLCLLIFIIGAAALPKKLPVRIWNAVWTLFFGVYSWAQFYVYRFRGDPVKFSDLSNLRSAMEIEGSYSFAPHYMSVFIYIDMAIMLFIIFGIDIAPCKFRGRIISGAVSVVGAITLLLTGSFAFDMAIKNRYIKLGFAGWENLESYQNIGMDLMFYFDGMYNRIEEPDGYSAEKAEDILSSYTEETAQDGPVIIGIMNESFADFSHIAEFDTNQDYMPNYRKLKEESISGYVTVSAYGGYSCNSEYEFLSGNSMNFLPAGSAVFTQCLNNDTESLVSRLKDLGYYTEAVTPCSKDLWNIGQAYEHLGFDNAEFSFCEWTSEMRYVNCNLSDSSLYKEFEKHYQQRSGDKPVFYWLTTMQNHGPYDCIDHAEGVILNDIDCPDAESYLSSIISSDEALGELTDYFRNVDEEVIIVMFGDHYPHIMDFTETLYGQSVSSLSVEEYSRLHQTPFLIWSNKGLEAEEIDDISLNYLSNEVFKAAGLPLSSYQQALEDIRNDIPIISGFGYKTADGEWHGKSETSDFEDTKNRYHILQYYRMFGND